jgi:tetratricopeptide (TPR) repeat protein
MRNYNEYELQIINYIKQSKGCILVCSHDITFHSLLNSVITNLVNDFSCIYIVDKIDKILDLENTLLEKYDRVLIFMEQYLYGEKTNKILLKVKKLCNVKCDIIYLTSKEETYTFSMMCDLCIDNVIIKPISIPNLIQKMYTTINRDNDMKMLVEACKAHIASDLVDEADELINMMKEKNPNSTIVYILSGDLCLSQAKYELAEYYYNQARTSSPLQIQPLYKLIELYTITDNIDKKLDILLKLDVLSFDDNIIQIKMEIGDCYLYLNNEIMSRKYYNQALELLKNEGDNKVKNIKSEIEEKLGSLKKNKD